MPYANINERRAKQKEQYQKKKIEYEKQDKKKKPVFYEENEKPIYNELNDRRNYGNGINKDDDDSESETESEADDDSEADTDSEADDEINDDELLTDYLVFLINYRDTKLNKYEKAINKRFKLIKCKNSNTYKIELY